LGKNSFDPLVEHRHASRAGTADFVAGALSYGLFRWLPELVSGVGKLAPMFLTIAIPAFALSSANKVHAALAAL
jgi:hypothetical protein